MSVEARTQRIQISRNILLAMLSKRQKVAAFELLEEILKKLPVREITAKSYVKSLQREAFESPEFVFDGYNFQVKN